MSVNQGRMSQVVVMFPISSWLVCLLLNAGENYLICNMLLHRSVFIWVSLELNHFIFPLLPCYVTQPSSYLDSPMIKLMQPLCSPLIIYSYSSKIGKITLWQIFLAKKYFISWHAIFYCTAVYLSGYTFKMKPLHLPPSCHVMLLNPQVGMGIVENSTVRFGSRFCFYGSVLSRFPKRFINDISWIRNYAMECVAELAWTGKFLKVPIY